LGFIHFAFLALYRCCANKIPDIVKLALAGAALVATLIGTILAGVGTVDGKTFSETADSFKTMSAAGYTVGTPGMGVSIAATIVQALALGITVYKKHWVAQQVKPTSSTEEAKV